MALDLSGGSGERLPGSRIAVWCGDGENRRRVAGVELWKRAIYTACRAGFEELLIVTSGSAEAVRRELAADPRLEGRDWQVIGAEDGWAERISSSGGRWVALEDRWVVDPSLLRELAETRGAPAAASPDGPLAADAAELALLVRKGWNPAHPLAETARSTVTRPSLYLRVSSERDRAAAEDELFQSLARNTTNFFARYVDRAMSCALSRRLAPYPITPNQITIFSTALGIVGGLLLLAPSYWWGVAGSFLFLASTVIDGCDGEIARLKFQESPAGAKLDFVADNVVHAVVFPCVALRAYLADPDGPFLLLGALCLLGVLASWAAVYALMIRRAPTPTMNRFFELVGNREFAYLFFFLGLIGHLEWFVWLMALVIWVFPVGLVVLRLVGV